MKLNIDCIRDLLLIVESDTSPGAPICFTALQEKLSDYSDDDIVYTALKLEEAGFIICNTRNARTYHPSLIITELTIYGHQFLEDIRSEKNWSKVKSVSKSVGSASLNVLSEIASSVIAGLIKSQL